MMTGVQWSLMLLAVLGGVVAMDCPDKSSSHPCSCSTVGSPTKALEIDCERKGLDEIPDFSVYRGKAIHFLAMSGNNFKSLPENFLEGLVFQAGYARQDPHIDLGSNPIRSIHPDAFSGIHGDTLGLRLAGCSLSEIPQPALLKFTNWTFLIFDDNKIDDVEEELFDGLTKVRHISLGKNPLNHLERGAFSGLEHVLEKLYLGDTGLTSLPEAAIRNLHQLSTLALQDNNIESLESKAFFDLETHEQLTIDLRRNNLETIHRKVFQGTRFSLKKLRLEENDLKNLEFLHDYCDNIFMRRPTINLLENPITCDCRLFETVRSNRMVLDGKCGNGDFADQDIEEFMTQAESRCAANGIDTSCPKKRTSAAAQTSAWLSLTLISIFILLL